MHKTTRLTYRAYTGRKAEHMLKDSILVGRDSYFYLNRMSRTQRGCKPLTEESENRVWERLHKVEGLAILDDDSMGGGDGTYYGKWWGWSLEKLKTMLDEAGYEYKSGPTREYISVHI